MIERADRGPVSILRMAHGKANALDVEMLHDLVTALEDVDASPAGAVVLTGTGTIFSAGVDLFKVIEGEEAYIERFMPALKAAFRHLFCLRKPVVAAINGHAIAGGCVLAAACDHRIMARDCGRIGVPELLVGVPFPALALEIMRFALPPQQFQAAVVTGATYEPGEALQRGFVDALIDADILLDRACEVAGRMAVIPAKAFRITKQTARRPVLESVKAAWESDASVLNAWKDPATRDAIRDYVERTIKKK